VGALSESYKCLGKAKLKNASSQEEKMAFIKQRIGLIKKFIQAKRYTQVLQYLLHGTQGVRIRGVCIKEVSELERCPY
jgi:hypothetical protein